MATSSGSRWRARRYRRGTFRRASDSPIWKPSLELGKSSIVCIHLGVPFNCKMFFTWSSQPSNSTKVKLGWIRPNIDSVLSTRLEEEEMTFSNRILLKLHVQTKVGEIPSIAQDEILMPKLNSKYILNSKFKMLCGRKQRRGQVALERPPHVLLRIVAL